MNIKSIEFSFEESLKYLDEMVNMMNDSQRLSMFKSIDYEELPVDRVAKVFCVAMSVKIENKRNHEGDYNEYIYAGAVSQIFSITRSLHSIRHIEMQTDGSILVLFDTPMKKDVEEVINTAAQVRSINDVVLKKFHVPQDEQVITIGIDYGLVSYFAPISNDYEGLYWGNAIKHAKWLSELKKDSVNISGDIYVNLSEEIQKNLFSNKETEGEVKYYSSPLINIRMRKWVVENKNE